MYKDTRGRSWIRTSPEINRRAKELRRQMTGAERFLWQRLRSRQVSGLKFRRQHPLGPYIFDFYCDELRLVIEIDGSIHDDPTIKANDAERDANCRAHGLTVLRFTNDDVFNKIDLIVHQIEEMRPSPPAPLPTLGEGSKRPSWDCASRTLGVEGTPLAPPLPVLGDAPAAGGVRAILELL